jgi:hypothetical protein
MEKIKRKHVLAYFDFEAVQSIMTAYGWKWGLGEVPSINELKSTAKTLLRRVKHEKLRFAISGGFVATRIGGDYYLFWGIDSTMTLDLIDD